MKAILPVAGAGSRLRPHTHTRPKALVTVAGKPVLGHILDELVAVGVDELVLIVGPFGEQIVHYVETHYDVAVHVVRQQEALGLGHAVYLARGNVREDEPVLVVLGDTIFKADLSAVLGGKENKLGVAEVDEPQKFGVVQLTDGTITRLVEKPESPPSQLALVGLYFFIQSGPLFSALQHIVDGNIRSRGEIQLTDALQRMVEQGEKLGVFSVSDWFDCGNVESLLATNKKLLESTPGESVPDRIRRSDSVIIPPVHIASSASVRGSVIGPFVSIAEGVVVDGSIIRNSIINKNATLSHLVLSDSVIGEGTQVAGSFSQLNIGDDGDVFVP